MHKAEKGQKNRNYQMSDNENVEDDTNNIKLKPHFGDKIGKKLFELAHGNDARLKPDQRFSEVDYTNSQLEETNGDEEKGRQMAFARKHKAEVVQKNHNYQPFNHEEVEDNTNNFKQKQHFEGNIGKKLLELAYGNDACPKPDQHFSEVDHIDRQLEETNDGTEEKERQMAILGSLVSLGGSHLDNRDSTKSRLGSKTFVRFDPNVKEHVQYERALDKELNDGKIKKLDRHGYEDFVQPLPEVSKERFYTSTAALDIGSNANSSFHLRSLFKQTDEEEYGVNNDMMEESTEFKPRPRVVKPDERVDKQQQAGYFKKVGMWQEKLFFQKDDTRFKEAMDFLLRDYQEEQYRDRDKWAQHRDTLKHFYRNKMRHHNTSSQRQANKRRTPFNQQNDSSYQFYDGPNGYEETERHHSNF